MRVSLLRHLCLWVSVVASPALAAGNKFPPDLAPTIERADAIHVYKSSRRMELLRNGVMLHRYLISLGDAPV